MMHTPDLHPRLPHTTGLTTTESPNDHGAEKIRAPMSTARRRCANWRVAGSAAPWPPCGGTEHGRSASSGLRPAPQAGRAAWRQGIRLQPPAAMVTRPPHHAPDRPQRDGLLGRHRWTIERTMAWLAGCRRLHRRYERNPRNYLAFLGLADALCCSMLPNGLTVMPGPRWRRARPPGA
ncbi:transposase [Streptomyces sp. NPDC054804]